MGLNVTEWSNIRQYLYSNEPLRRDFYDTILEERWHFDELMLTVGEKGMKKEENMKEIAQNRSRALKRISILLKESARNKMIFIGNNRIPKDADRMTKVVRKEKIREIENILKYANKINDYASDLRKKKLNPNNKKQYAKN